MYNRYLRNDPGEHQRVDERRGATQHSVPNSQRPTQHHSTQHGTSTAPLGGLFSGIFGKLNLNDLDSGDFLLLLLIFLLLHEGGDEELLIALGLLLIM